MTFEVLGVAGAGPMGAGIAQVGLTSGMKVVLFDLSSDALAKAAKDIEARIARLVEKGKLAEGFTAAAMERLTLAGSTADFAPCDIVVEAIIERLEPKQKLFADVEKVVKPGTILASNTSSLSVAAIAAGCADKGRVCGLHFFNPVPLMKLVEVVVAPSTTQDVADRATAFCQQIDKTPVSVKDGPGFLVNLQGRAYSLEALAIVQESVTDPATLDRIMRDAAGYRMGPFELMDLTGIDVNFAASQYISQGYQYDPRLKTTTLHELMANAGRFGRKTGQGFFDYADGVSFAPSPAASASPSPVKVAVGEADAALEKLIQDAGMGEGGDIVLIAPVGEDCASACARLGLDPKKTVAIDLTALGTKHLTVMSAVGGGDAAAGIADWLRGAGYKVEQIQDSPGFVLQRMLGMMANLACELAQIGVGTPEDIDLAMKLAQNYPKGPIEWGEWLGAGKTHEIMKQLHAITGSDRYRPSLWLRRRAQLSLSLYAKA
jgi:3-hydroxybutyryl-CoA dehydrogenase